MNLEQFLSKCEDSFGGKSYTLLQKAAFMEKCSRFNAAELQRIFSDLLENNKYLPRIADIYESARSLGMLDKEQMPLHRWIGTDCNYCRGEGRMGIIWRCQIEERETGLVEIQELVDLFQYSKAFDRQLKSNEYRSLFRCRCSAGDAETLPKGWPRWTATSEPRRTVWL